MQRRHRTAHARIWTALAIIIPAVDGAPLRRQRIRDDFFIRDLVPVGNPSGGARDRRGELELDIQRFRTQYRRLRQWPYR